MAISHRIKRLLCADVHAVLDVIEEPEAILKQAIREMQEALDWKKARLAGNEKTLLSLQANQAHLEKELPRIEEDLALALREGSQELARGILARRLATQKHLEGIHRRIADWQALCQRRREEIGSQEAQLESILEKSKMFVRPSSEDSPFSVAESILTSEEGMTRGTRSPAAVRVTEEEIELEWLRIRDRLAGGGAS